MHFLKNDRLASAISAWSRPSGLRPHNSRLTNKDLLRSLWETASNTPLSPAPGSSAQRWHPLVLRCGPQPRGDF